MSIRYVEKKIAELENSVKANSARNSVANNNSNNNAFVFDTNNGNFVRNMVSLSLIPASKRIDVGPKRETEIPYDIRSIAKILNTGGGTKKVPHTRTPISNAVIAEVNRRVPRANGRSRNTDKNDVEALKSTVDLMKNIIETARASAEGVGTFTSGTSLLVSAMRRNGRIPPPPVTIARYRPKQFELSRKIKEDLEVIADVHAMYNANNRTVSYDLFWKIQHPSFNIFITEGDPFGEIVWAEDFNSNGPTLPQSYWTDMKRTWDIVRKAFNVTLSMSGIDANNNVNSLNVRNQRALQVLQSIS